MSVASHQKPLLLPEQWVFVQENSLLHNLPPPTGQEKDDSSIRAIKQLITELPSSPVQGAQQILCKVHN